MTGHALWSPIAGGTAFLGTYFGGEQNNTWLVTYDASSAQIKTFAVTAAGGVFEGVYFKRDGQWAMEETGSFADGRRITGTYQIEITNGGDTHRWTGSVVVDGEPGDPLNDVWQRVSKPSGM